MSSPENPGRKRSEHISVERDSGITRRAVIAALVGWGGAGAMGIGASSYTGTRLIPQWEEPKQLTEEERQRRNAEIETDKKIWERVEGREGELKDAGYWSRI
jgi:hypothetical protein